MMIWSIGHLEGGEVVVARFEGHLSADEGARALDSFLAALGAAPRDVVFDIREMSGYDTGAREAWQKGLFPVRTRIRSLTVVGGSPVVRMGASLIAVVLGKQPNNTLTVDTPPRWLHTSAS